MRPILHSCLGLPILTPSFLLSRRLRAALGGPKGQNWVPNGVFFCVVVVGIFDLCVTPSLQLVALCWQAAPRPPFVICHLLVISDSIFNISDVLFDISAMKRYQSAANPDWYRQLRETIPISSQPLLVLSHTTKREAAMTYRMASWITRK